ncbi:MAG: DsbA family protein, partial [Odoribacter sp.]|nr:DsbA family protein [Odoribacter sp.]
LVLIEYGDYECPYCGQAYYVVKKIQQELGNDLAYVFRNFPLVQLHPYAMSATMAAEAAAEQGKFWEMHDTLYQNQDNLENSDLLKYAQEVGLDISRFKDDFGSDKLQKKIEEDYESGIQLNLRGTPSFFVNGEPYNGNWMEPEFLEYLKSLL